MDEPQRILIEAALKGSQLHGVQERLPFPNLTKCITHGLRPCGGRHYQSLKVPQLLLVLCYYTVVSGLYSEFIITNAISSLSSYLKVFQISSGLRPVDQITIFPWPSNSSSKLSVERIRDHLSVIQTPL